MTSPERYRNDLEDVGVVHGPRAVHAGVDGALACWPASPSLAALVATERKEERGLRGDGGERAAVRRLWREQGRQNLRPCTKQKK